MRLQSIVHILVLSGITSLTLNAFPPLQWNFDSKSSRFGKIPESHILSTSLLQLEKQATDLEAEAKVQGKESVVYAKMTVVNELLKKVWKEVDSFSSSKSEQDIDKESEEVFLLLGRLSALVTGTLKNPDILAIINEHRYHRQQGIQQNALFCWSFVSGAYLLSGPAYYAGSLGITATGLAWKAYERICRDTTTFLTIKALEQAIEKALEEMKK